MIKKWPCNVYVETHLPSGRKITITAIVEGSGDPDGAALALIQTRKNAYSFLGCEVTITTPLGQKIHRVLETDGESLRLDVLEEA